MLDRQALCEAWEAGARSEFIFFWGLPSGIPEGTMGPWIFSQWHAAPFVIDGIKYATAAEHWMMAGKARLFNDATTLDRILRDSTMAHPDPDLAKKLGRQVESFNNEIWLSKAMEIVVEGNIAKFSQNREMGLFLEGTGDRVLVEASPQDVIWGIGLRRSDPNAADPRHWKGQNLLGFALMEARKVISNRQS